MVGKLILRLDDGSIIGSNLLGDGAGTARISMHKAAELNLAGQKEAQRLERLLDTARAFAPKPTQHIAPQLTPIGGGSTKRARVDSGHLATTDVAPTGDWHGKCKTILDQIGKKLSSIKTKYGNMKATFWEAVNPKMLPDYYTIVKDPIFFGQIEEKLIKRKYSSPLDFHADMKQSFENCRLYNPVNDPFRSAGEKAEDEFDKQWNNSSVGADADARGKRATAGIARPKYEPEVFEAPSQPRSQSQGAKGNKQPASKTKGGFDGRGVEAPISDTRKNEMGELLQSEAMGDHMEALMALLPPEVLEGADGEFELDFESLDDGTIRKIDNFLRATFGPPAEEAGASPPASPGSMQQDDDDEVSEGDLDDADESDDD